MAFQGVWHWDVDVRTSWEWPCRPPFAPGILVRLNGERGTGTCMKNWAL